jgi:hypothetical protein
MLAVVTTKPRFYQQAVIELEKAGENFLSLSSTDEIPTEVDIVITSSTEKDSIDFPRIVCAQSAGDAVREALLLNTGLKKRYNSISIGIDPGKSIGIAAMGEKRVIYEDVLSGTEEVAGAVKMVEERFVPGRIEIKIGSAGGAYRDRIIASLQKNFDHRIEIVDEELTTKPKVESRRIGVHKDILAARKIATKKGKPLKVRIEASSTPGEIRNIQQESRKKSGHLTISKELAESVVKGEISLDEAITRQEKRLG